MASPVVVRVRAKYAPYRVGAWPALKIGEKEMPKGIDFFAAKHPSKGRTGNSNGIVKRRNKGGKRAACWHGASGHGPCGCHG